MIMQRSIRGCAWRAWIALVAAMALTLAGCGGGSGGSNEMVATNQPTVPPIVPPPQQPAAIIPAPGEMVLLAGSLGGAGNLDGQSGRLNGPTKLAADASGNVYVADFHNNAMRKITPSGAVSTLDVPMPTSLVFAVDPAGNFYAGTRDGNPYYGTQSCAILKTTPAGLVTTFAVPTYACDYFSLYSIAVDARGAIYMSNSRGVHRSTPEGDFRTLGDVPPGTLSVDRANNLYVFLSPYGPPQPTKNMFKVTPEGAVTAFETTSARRQPFGDVARDPASGTLYVLDYESNSQGGGSHFIVRQETSDGIVSTLALTNSDGTPAQLPGEVAFGGTSQGMTIGPDGSIFVAFPDENTIMKIAPNRVLTIFAGVTLASSRVDGTGGAARFYAPAHLVSDNSGNVLVTDSRNDAIRKISSAGVVTTLAASVSGFDSTSSSDRCSLQASLLGLAINKSDLFVGTPYAHRIFKIGADGSKTVVAGATWPDPHLVPGPNGAVSICESTPVGVAVDSAGTLYVPDGAKVRKITAAGADTFLSCSNMPTCLYPNLAVTAVAVDAADNLYVAQYGTIYKITPGGISSVLAGGGTTPGDSLGSLASFNNPRALTVDAAGNVFVADTGNHTVRKITPSGVVTTIAGKRGSAGVIVGKLPASLNSPRGIAVDAAGMIYVSSENAVLKINP